MRPDALAEEYTGAIQEFSKYTLFLRLEGDWLVGKTLEGENFKTRCMDLGWLLAEGENIVNTDGVPTIFEDFKGVLMTKSNEFFRRYLTDVSNKLQQVQD
jgi:hypothetical protein